MRVRLPRRSWPLWLAGVGLWFVIAPVAGDGSDVPLPYKAWAAVILLPAVLLLIAPFLVRYRGGGPALVWQAQGLIPALLSLLALAVTVLGLFVAFGMATIAPSWWRAMLMFAYWAAWAFYLQLLRAAAAHRARVRTADRRLRSTFG